MIIQKINAICTCSKKSEIQKTMEEMERTCMKVLSITADREFVIESIQRFAKEHSNEKIVFLVRGELLRSPTTGLPLLEELAELCSDLFPEFELESLGGYFAEGYLGELKCFFLSISSIPLYGLQGALLSLEGLDAAVGVKLLYKRDLGIGYLREVFEALSGCKISELIIEAPIDYHEADEEPFIRLFLEYRDFLQTIEFSTTFLDSFRPVKCPYLSPASDFYMYKNRDFFLCPYGEALHGAGDVNQIRKELLSIRLKDFSNINRKFRCDDCVAAMKGLMVSGMEVNK